MVLFEEAMELLGGMAFLGDICHCGWALRVYNHAQILVCIFFFVSVVEDTFCQLPAPVTVPADG